MSYTLELSETGAFISLLLKEGATQADHCESGSALLTKVNESGCKYILIDARLSPMNLNITDQFSFSVFLTKTLPLGTKMAVIQPVDKFEESKFPETVAVNRGLMIKMFRNEKEATLWLLADC